MVSKLPRLLLAAPSSGSGKTTAVCAVLGALKRKGFSLATFKCGPDYIDPMFHREAIGTRFSGNLDLFFCDEPTVRSLLRKGAKGADLAVLEGVMGYYDGVALSSQASPWHLAKATKTPVILVVNCRGMSVSVAAMIKGYLDFREDHQIKGVLLNQAPPSLYPQMKELIQRECGLPVVGYLPVMKECALESRHLGLVTAGEVENLSQKLERLAVQGEQTLDLELLIKLAGEAPTLKDEPVPFYPPFREHPKVAVAQDKAFSFYYQESLALLEEMGACLIPFSPLEDSAIPKEAQALWLGGGYPELYAQTLSQNVSMRNSIKAALDDGMPVIGECGGFLYLQASLEDSQGISWPMVGYLPGRGFQSEGLRRFGYCALTAKRDNLLCMEGETLPAHEFHRWDSDQPGDSFFARKPQRDTSWECVYTTPRVYAGFPHLYLAGTPKAAERFLRAAIAYGKEGHL